MREIEERKERERELMRIRWREQKRKEEETLHRHREEREREREARRERVRSRLDALNFDALRQQVQNGRNERNNLYTPSIVEDWNNKSSYNQLRCFTDNVEGREKV